MDAFRRMRFYASEDSNAKVSFTINGYPMGSVIPEEVSEIKIAVEVTDKSTEKVKSITILTGRPGSNQSSTSLGGASVSNTNVLNVMKAVTSAKRYYYVEIIQKDGDRIYTSPIWINE